MKSRLFILIQFSTFFSFSLLGQQVFTKQDVISKMKVVNDFWISQNPNPGNNQWARSAYFTGDIDFYKLYPKDSYKQYAELWAKNNNWTLNGGIYTRVADNQISGQTYIDLYNLDSIKQPAKIATIKASIDSMIHTSKSDDWWWIDALYMAMPVFAKIGAISNNDSVYFNKMYQLYSNTKVTRGLFNSNEALWYRDESFKPPFQTPGGKNSFWARGNGWVLAAHVKVLQLLPLHDTHRAEYVDTFQKMAAALKCRQRSDGFWNVSLDDSTDYGGIETSGTSFFTYAIAWGINNALLDSATYYPVVAKAWNALSTVAVQSNGFLGYVQGVGSGPSSSQPVTVSSTADFGVGAFLLAGTEVVQLAHGAMPIPSNFSVQAISVQDNTHIKVSFSKKINLFSALLPANYLINNVIVTSVNQSDNDSSIVLTVDTLNFGKYSLQVNNVFSSDSVAVESDVSTSFVYSGIAGVTASGFESGTSNTPDKTIDFDFSTRWSAYGIGQWIIYNLGESKLVNSVDLAFYNGDIRKGYFSISLSNLTMDSTAFHTVFDGASSGTTKNFENYKFIPQPAKFVKITGKGNSQNVWNSITETRINYDSIPTALKTLDYQNVQFNVFPNPFSGNKLNIISQNLYGRCNLRILSLSGDELFSRNIELKNNKATVDNLSLTKGLYLISIKNYSFSGSLLLFAN